MRVDDLELAAVPATSGTDLGYRFVAAIAAKDAVTLLAMFDHEVDFRAMTPGRTWEPPTAADVVDDVILGTWFERGDIVEAVEAVQAGLVGDRHSLGYRLRVTNGDGRFLVEQQAFFDVTEGKITWMRVLCSGFRPVAGTGRSAQ